MSPVVICGSGRILTLADLRPPCICGLGPRTLAAAWALRGNYGIPTGKCHRHPERGADERTGARPAGPHGSRVPGPG